MVAPMDKPLFDALVESALGKVLETCQQRGAHYGDSYRANQWLTSKAIEPHINGHPNPHLVRALAALVDVKYARQEGGWDKDHLVDLINYAAALLAAMDAECSLPGYNGDSSN